jgi:hypothetical protein
MLEADKLGCIKHYMEETAHGGTSKMDWGGIQLIILVGDDYQIPPIGYGAFHSFSPIKKIEDNKPINPGQMACRMIGFDEFKASAKNVVYLEGVKRVNSEQDQLQSILRNLQCEDDNNDLCKDDIQRLLELDMNHHQYSRKERDKIEASAMYLFANKEPRNALNEKMLLKADLAGNPVAQIKATSISQRGAKNHFEEERNPSMVMLCKTAKVALNGQNICPSHLDCIMGVSESLKTLFSMKERPQTMAISWHMFW